MGRQSSTHDEGTSTPQEHRSLNTSRSYASKQEEFKSWCNDRFPENTKHIVTGEKLHSFLSEAVMNRQSRRGRKAVDMDRKVKSSTMELYVAAITDLFQKQVRLGINSHPHPRIPAVKQLLRNMRREDMLKRIESNSKGATGGGAGSAAAQKSPSPMTHQRSSELAHSQRKQ
ncbi:hypothetical protein BDF14DRAFT_894775 [Spinellus fusiger]|nr:hypothetical protein BDF14DRAFT_894775 [Spinellus fusiger]